VVAAVADVLAVVAGTGFKVVQVAQVVCRSSPMDPQSPVMALNQAQQLTPLHCRRQLQLL
jgi:hypothetical protein